MTNPDTPRPGPDLDAQDLDAYVAAAAPLLGLTLDPAWVDPVAANLRVLAAAAGLVGGFALPDEAEAAPVFEA